ncbi:MAG TPA: hypothetical protein VFP32_01165 [Candidatus Saccharimonadales bacterium]|nr:hypothetical protein [Candidatus Saccharimonadales bacterium]
MKRQKNLLGLLGVIILVASLFLQAIPVHRAYADQITTRSLTLQAGATDPGSKPSGVVNHLFQFTLPNTVAANPSGDIGSLKIQYCTTAADVGAQTCVKPTGLTTATVTGVDETGSGVTGWSLVTVPPPPDGTILVTRTANNVAPGTAVKMLVQGVTNPSDPNKTFFARISSYVSVDGTGSAIDTGTVAAATANPIQLNGVMPESLVFCTGAAIGVSSNVPDCSTATAGNINFDRLFDPTDTAQATSQMAASTNAGSGYSITVNGTTLKSGTNQVNPIGTADYSRKGTSQFGLNLVKNTAFCGVGCDLGADVTAAGGTLYNGEALTGYNTGGDNTTVAAEGAQFKFTTGDAVADSTSAASDAQIFTVSYVVNVPGSQPAGTYTTTLTYICTATY